MSYVTIGYLYCDFCGPNNEPYSIDPLPGSTSREERYLAHRDGWTQPVINGRRYDRCADCTAERRESPNAG